MGKIIKEEFEGHEDFYNFLLERKCAEDYVNFFNNTKPSWRLLNWSKYKDDYSVKDFLNNSGQLRYTFNAFPWEKTNGGYKFWKDINTEWKNQVNQLRAERVKQYHQQHGIPD
jgi:hypothetical protein